MVYTNTDSSIAREELDTAFGEMILSASGWRGIFAAGEESAEPELSTAHQLIAAGAAKVFADYLKSLRNAAPPGLILGMDTRPTSGALADTMIQAFLHEGCSVYFASIVAAPEIMAFARSMVYSDRSSLQHIQGFAYISASHNPIGHNGLKFGLLDGGVLPGDQAALLTNALRTLIASPEAIPQLCSLLADPPKEELRYVYARAAGIKQDALNAYFGFTKEVTSGFASEEGQTAFIQGITRGLRDFPLGIGADLNGSARAASIDASFFAALGIPYRVINDTPGAIAHRIVPEGESLEPCRELLERLHREDPSFVLGYMPDCDGDRGNLVMWDDRAGSARILEAQEVFALACMGELAYLLWAGDLQYSPEGTALTPVALAVNDPTSLRIDSIAHSFDAQVFRAEVGEANVVSLARKLRQEGYTVRILGEGSAGGTITHPSAVRDPLNTLMALVKLLAIRSDGEKPGLFQIWCNRSNQNDAYRPNFTLSDVIATLPHYTTTGVYTPEALLTVKATDHAALKDAYQTLFLQEWEARREYLQRRYGIYSWEASGYLGIEEKRGIARFGEAQRGGLRIVFANRDGKPIGSLWMRGSGTEPVFRVMADAEGSETDFERYLIEWQRHMVLAADAAIGPDRRKGE